MTDQNVFFRILWRFNAFVIAIAGLGAIAILGLAYQSVNSDLIGVGPRGGTGGQPHYELEGGPNTGAVAGANVIDGTQESYLYLTRQPYPGRMVILSSSGQYIGVLPVNVMVIDGATAKGRWLFGAGERNIRGTLEVRAHLGNADPNPVHALLFTVVEKGADAPDDSPQALYAYRPGTPRAVRLAIAGSVVTVSQTGDDTATVVALDGDRRFAYVFQDLTLRAKSELPPMPVKAVP